MYKELVQRSQGYKHNVVPTHRFFLLSHKEIQDIQKGKTKIYTRILSIFEKKTLNSMLYLLQLKAI